MEGESVLISTLTGDKKTIKSEIDRILAGYLLESCDYDHKETYCERGGKGKVKYYYQDLPVLIIVDKFL